MYASGKFHASGWDKDVKGTFLFILEMGWTMKRGHGGKERDAVDPYQPFEWFGFRRQCKIALTYILDYAN